MPRIIQDSDDEDLGDEPLISSGDTFTADNVGSRIAVKSAVCPVVEQPAGMRGTSSSGMSLHHVSLIRRPNISLRSTEKLRRDIETAHSALFEPTPSTGKRRAADDLDIVTRTDSPETSRVKRSRTTGATTTIISTAGAQEWTDEGSKLDGKMSLKTYARKSASCTAGNGQKGGTANVGDVSSSSSAERTIVAVANEGPGDVDDAAAVGGTRRNSLKRRRTVREDSPDPLGSNGDVVSRQDEIQLVPGSGEGATQLQPSGEEPSSLGFAKVEGFEAHNPNALFPDTSSSSHHNSSTTNHVHEDDNFLSISVQRREVTESVTASENATRDSMTVQRDSATMAVEETSYQSVRSNDTLATMESTTLIVEREPMVVVEVPARRPETEESTDHRHSARRKNSKTDGETPFGEPSSDDIAVGPPKELYKPRPSRSRASRKTVADPAELAVAAVKDSKSKLRRRKTTGAISAYSSSLREMGFRSSQVEYAMSESSGNVHEALEWLTTHNDTTFGSQRGGLQSITEEEVTEERNDGPVRVPDEEDMDDFPANSKDTEMLTKPNKRSRGRPRKQPQPTDVIVPNDDPLPVEEEIPVHDNVTTATPVVVESKKKARGRPKKAQKLSQDDAEIEEEEETPQDQAEFQARQPDGSRHVLQDINVNQQTKNQNENKLPLGQGNQSLSTPPRDASDRQPPPAKDTRERSSTPGTSKRHSPLKNGRLPLKVGLSKRARIEPLLRVVRK